MTTSTERSQSAQRRAKVFLKKISASLCVLCALCVESLYTQGRSAPDWTAQGADAQRSSWIAVDPWLSLDTMPQFRFLWKLKVDNEARQLNALTAPVSMANLNSFRGFKSVVFVGGSSNNVYAIDYDFGTLFWKTHFNYSSGVTEYAGSPACPGGMTAGLTRPTNLTPASQLPFMGFARPPRPARGEVGEPGRGAPGLMPEPPNRGRGAPADGRGAPAPPVAAPVGRGLGPNVLVAIGGDGIARALNPINGDLLAPAARFLPPNSNVGGLIYIGGVGYAATSSACGGAPDAIWAMDFSGDEKPVVSWKSDGASIAGFAFGTDGTIYATLGAGASAHASSVVALDGRGLSLKDWVTVPGADFVSPPVVFDDGKRTRVVAAGSDGRLFVLDGASLGGADHKTPMLTSSASQRTVVAGLSTWRDGRGTRWILANLSKGRAVAAFTFDESGGAPGLKQAWLSRDLTAPRTPIVINGVVFALAGGTASVPAVLYALDPGTGKEIWNSGTTITSFATADLAAGTGQVYVVTHDNTVWTFGFPQAY